MKTEWNYTELADAYLKRPDYAVEAIDAMLQKASVPSNGTVCDVGAGVAHLTLMLAEKKYNVFAVEPNDAMRANGIKRTAAYPNVKWFEGVGEDTGMEANKFDLVTFGSSFNVCNREVALAETSRILKQNGWFACMWNHRELDDPLQQQIEKIIMKYVSDYSYGSRREDQTEIINQSGLFNAVEYIEGSIIHTINVDDFIEGWRSHGTVHRQSKEKFHTIIDEIADVVISASKNNLVEVPYETRIWIAQKKD
jgi:ubiquinone/menaquinone biosynthesis C-methylase UbiE